MHLRFMKFFLSPSALEAEPLGKVGGGGFGMVEFDYYAVSILTCNDVDLNLINCFLKLQQLTHFCGVLGFWGFEIF